MEYTQKIKNAKIQNRVAPLTSGVTLTDGRLKTAFDWNIKFLKRFDVDRLLYWYRQVVGEPSPKAPYAFDKGFFEGSLHGQTAAMFLMGAGTTLLWQEDAELRLKMDAVVAGMKHYQRENGCLVPVPEEELFTKEYPNYIRAWITFGLLAAGAAGNADAYEIVRKFGDWFNTTEHPCSVKDMNLGFQGILANTALYLSPVGVKEDLETGIKCYREDFWLEWVHNKEHKAIYQKPGNHPHGTLLTTLEGYLDVYRATGEEYLLECVKTALGMYEDKWQHVGGGIVMCEDDKAQAPGAYLITRDHHYNELCCSTFWVLLNQRMHLLEPDNAHYTDQIEQSLYNMLIACQAEDRGFHYWAYIDGAKDMRFADPVTCCASTGTRLTAMLPQFLYSYNDEAIYVDMFASSVAEIGESKLEVTTNMPYDGEVCVSLVKWAHSKLKIRIPYWCGEAVTINGVTANAGEYLELTNVKSGDIIKFNLPFAMRKTLYTGVDKTEEDLPRWAIEYGPLLLASLRRDDYVFTEDIATVKLSKIEDGRYRLNDNTETEFMAYMDITTEPFKVYSVFGGQKND